MYISAVSKGQSLGSKIVSFNLFSKRLFFSFTLGHAITVLNRICRAICKHNEGTTQNRHQFA